MLYNIIKLWKIIMLITFFTLDYYFNILIIFTELYTNIFYEFDTFFFNLIVLINTGHR